VDLEATADRLIETCLARKAPDNVTFILLRIRERA
jgi:serine/threonine protein phosphatase PrpC